MNTRLIYLSIYSANIQVQHPRNVPGYAKVKKNTANDERIWFKVYQPMQQSVIISIWWFKDLELTDHFIQIFCSLSHIIYPARRVARVNRAKTDSIYPKETNRKTNLPQRRKHCETKQNQTTIIIRQISSPMPKITITTLAIAATTATIAMAIIAILPTNDQSRRVSLET